MDAEYKQRLAKAIREARGDRSQRKFAKDIGVSYVTVQNWENGSQQPGLEYLEAIATARGMTLESFLAFVRQRESEETHRPKVAEDSYATAKHLSRQEKARLIALLAEDLANH